MSISGLISYDFGGKFFKVGTTIFGFLGRVACDKSPYLAISMFFL